MSDTTDELKMAVMVGLTIALVFKTLDYFSRFFSKMIAEAWENAPDFVIEMMSFVIVLIVFIIFLLILIARSGDK
jgi:uncharacterized membrane protein YdbT with pleckstrin-like domain